MIYPSVMMVPPGLAMIGDSRRGTLLQIDSLSTPGLTTTSWYLRGASPQSSDRTTAPTVIDPFELAAFVTSRRGTPVRPVIIGLFLTLPFSVSGSGTVALVKVREVRTLCSMIPLWCRPGSLTLTMAWFGMADMCVDSVDTDCVTLLDRLTMWSVPSFGVGLSLHSAIIGLGRMVATRFPMLQLLSMVLSRWVPLPKVLVSRVRCLMALGVASSARGGCLQLLGVVLLKVVLGRVLVWGRRGGVGSCTGGTAIWLVLVGVVGLGGVGVCLASCVAIVDSIDCLVGLLVGRLV